MDELDVLVAQERAAEDAWLSEVKLQRANKTAGRPVSGARMEELFEEYERASQRVRDFKNKALGP